MSDLVLHLAQALGACQPLGLMDALRVADQIFSPAQPLDEVLSDLMSVPVVGVVLVPAYVAFGVSARCAGLVMAALILGSGLLCAAASEATALLTASLAFLQVLRAALGAP